METAQRKKNTVLTAENYLNKRQTIVEKSYWKKFYQSFTDYLYKDCGYYDNYVRVTIKNIKVIFWLSQ